MDGNGNLIVDNDAEAIVREHNLAWGAAETFMDHATKCGELLQKKKDDMRHGVFKPWIRANCPFSYATANSYMKAAREKSRGLNFSSLKQLTGIQGPPIHVNHSQLNEAEIPEGHDPAQYRAALLMLHRLEQEERYFRDKDLAALQHLLPPDRPRGRAVFRRGMERYRRGYESLGGGRYSRPPHPVPVDLSPTIVRHIHIAGFFQNQCDSSDGLISAASNPEARLESYFYLKDQPTARDRIRQRGMTIFLDSGAYSAYTQAEDIKVNDYGDFLEQHADLYSLAASLDVIGAGNEQRGYDNLKALEGRGLKVLPTHHFTDQDQWLIRYLDEGYDHLCLGGLVKVPPKEQRLWLDRIWSTYLLNEDGSPKVKVHGFGLTNLELMRRYPWRSCDSTTWVKCSRFGQVYLDLPDEGQLLQLSISDESPRIDQLDQHYDSLTAADRRRMRERIEQLDFKIDDLRTSYGWRDRFNIQCFNRLQHWPVDLSWWRWPESIDPVDRDEVAAE